MSLISTTDNEDIQISQNAFMCGFDHLSVPKYFNSQKMISIGSYSLETAGVLEIFDCETQNWTKMDLNIKKSKYCVALIDNKLMLIGGYDPPQNAILNTVESIDMLTGIKRFASPLNEPRHYASSVVLGEGKTAFLYVFGGWGTEKLLKTVERWDPISEVWTFVTPMTVRCSGFGLAYLLNKIYVVGGRTKGNYKNNVEAYNVKTDSWEIKAPMKCTNAYFGMTTHKNCLYVVAGNKEYESLIDTVERYDPGKDSWTTLANISSKGSVGLTSFRNKLVCAGGRESTIVEEYDEDENKWITMPSLNVAREGSYLIDLPETMNNNNFDWSMIRDKPQKLLCIRSADHQTSGIMEVYNSSKNLWTQLKKLDIDKIDYGVAFIDDKLMMIGGTNSINTILNTVEIVDLLTGNIKEGACLQTHRQYAGVAVVGKSKAAFLYVFGGWGENETILKSVERWDPISQVWTYVTPLPNALSGIAVAVLDNKIYVAGGRQQNFVYVNNMDRYDIERDKWESMSSMKCKNAYFQLVAHKNHLYSIAGNQRHTELLNTVERYDPRENSWTTLANISSKGFVGATSFRNKLICAGGRKSNIVEEYDEDKNEWKAMALLNVEREESTLIELPQTMNDYKFDW